MQKNDEELKNNGLKFENDDYNHTAEHWKLLPFVKLQKLSNSNINETNCDNNKLKAKNSSQNGVKSVKKSAVPVKKPAVVAKKSITQKSRFLSDVT